MSEIFREEWMNGKYLERSKFKLYDENGVDFQVYGLSAAALRAFLAIWFRLECGYRTAGKGYSWRDGGIRSGY